MINATTPSFKDFQRDIERHLEREGKREKNEHGRVSLGAVGRAPERLERVGHLHIGHREQGILPDRFLKELGRAGIVTLDVIGSQGRRVALERAE